MDFRMPIAHCPYWCDDPNRPHETTFLRCDRATTIIIIIAATKKPKQFAFSFQNQTKCVHYNNDNRTQKPKYQIFLQSVYMNSDDNDCGIVIGNQ